MALGDIRQAFVQVVTYDPNATLTNGSRKGFAGDNDSDLALYADYFLKVQYDGGPPSAGTLVADLYVLPGDGSGSEIFAEGGDGTVGSNNDPQKVNLVGSFESRAPSTSVDEVLCIPGVALPNGDYRIVVKNTSGQTFDTTWELRETRYALKVLQS